MATSAHAQRRAPSGGTITPAQMSPQQLAQHCRRLVFDRHGVHFYPGWVEMDDVVFMQESEKCIRDRGKY